CSIPRSASSSHSAYASLVAVNPAGRAVPNPGRASAIESPSRILLRESQIRLVSGSPWNKTGATTAILRAHRQVPPARPCRLVDVEQVTAHRVRLPRRERLALADIC